MELKLGRAPDVRLVTSITPVRLRTGMGSRSDKSVDVLPYYARFVISVR